MFSLQIATKRRADERTRIADLLQLRVCSGMFQNILVRPVM